MIGNENFKKIKIYKHAKNKNKHYFLKKI